MSSTPSSAGIGSKRLVVGAHYGVGNWLLQRLTAVVLAVFTLYLALRLVFGGALGYDGWAGMFAPLPMKIVTLRGAARAVLSRVGRHARHLDGLRRSPPGCDCLCRR